MVLGIDREARNWLEMSPVAGDEDEPARECGRGDEQIGITNQVAPAAEITTDGCEALHGRAVER